MAEAEKVELILGDHEELDPMVKEAPWIPSFSVLAITVEIIAQPGVPYEGVTRFFDGWIQQRKEQGRSVIITPGALRVMREGDDEILNRLVEEHLEEHYELEPVSSGGFEGFRLVRKG